MGKYLDIIERATECDQSDISDQSGRRTQRDQSDISDQSNRGGSPAQLLSHITLWSQVRPFEKTFRVLERGCPALVEVPDWQQAVEDARQFLTMWGEQSQALGWTARDLFGLHPVPPSPHPSYRRLSRYDEIGLLWLLRGRPVVALTATTAAISNPTGNVTVYRRLNKPALGPLGDDLDDMS